MPKPISDDVVAIRRTTLPHLFLEAFERHGPAPAFGRIQPSLEIESFSFTQIREKVRQVAGALDARGLVRGDRAAILSENRLEWVLADLGALCSGVVVVPVYASLKPPQIAFILRDSGAKLVFVPTPEHMAKVVEARALCEHAFDIVVFDPPATLPDGVTSWETFLKQGAERAAGIDLAEFSRRAQQAEPDDVATILYTSGTTGESKGVMLTHGNVSSNILATSKVLPIAPGDVTLSFLPLTHIFQRMVDFLFLVEGCTVVHGRTMQTITDDMRRVRPTVIAGVPRVYEKMYQAITQARGMKKKLVAWAVRVAQRTADQRMAGREPRGLHALEQRLADRLVFSKIRASTGGRIRWFVSASAPLSPVLSRFFYGAGLKILEGYGLTETSPVTSVNSDEHFRIGTVGRVLPGTEVRIASDGEILVRGPQVMKGYYNRTEDTAQALVDGWFHTGDIGEIDRDGFLRITDRKKDLIKTAGGKIVAPAIVENRLKTCALVEQAVMVGDQRKFVSLLVVPRFAVLEPWARAQQIAWSTRAELIEDERVQKHVGKEIRTHFDGLASYETPKKIALLDEEFTVANGFLTPSLKIKRRLVQEHFEGLIDTLYGGASETSPHD